MCVTRYVLYELLIPRFCSFISKRLSHNCLSINRTLLQSLIVIKQSLPNRTFSFTNYAVGNQSFVSVLVELMMAKEKI